MTICKHCGELIEYSFDFSRYRHADSPHTWHCIINGQVAKTWAEPLE